MSDKPKLTPREAYALLTKFVEEKGKDYVYEQPVSTDEEGYESKDCLYVHDGTPSCLVGHVFVGAGVPVEEILPFEGSAAHSVAGSLLDVDGPLINALDAAQKQQDGGNTWGEALAAFEQELNMNGVDYK